MRMRELLESPVHLMRGYDLRDMKHVDGPYFVSAEEHDVGQYAFELYKKVVDTDDQMQPAYQSMGFIPGLSSYNSKWPNVIAAAKQMIAKLGH